MAFKIKDYTSNADYAVGCDTESARELFPAWKSDDLAARYEEFNYIAFFNRKGEKIDEVKIVGGDDAEYKVLTEF